MVSGAPRNFHVIGLSSRNSILGYEQIRRVLSPNIELPEPLIDLEDFFDEVSEFENEEYLIFSHNQHRVPKQFRKRTIIFALQTVVNRLRDDIKVRNSFLEFPPALILTPTETAANDLRKMGFEARCLYRPSSNLDIPEKCPLLMEKPVILWYWKPDHPPIVPYIEDIIDIMDSIDDIEIWTFPSSEKPLEKSNIKALGRIEMSEIVPMVDGLVRVTSRLDYGRSTYDVLSNGRWALYNDMPHEEFSINAELEVFEEEIRRLIEQRSNERVLERHDAFKKHFEVDEVKERWLDEFSKCMSELFSDFKKSDLGFEFRRRVGAENIVLKNFASKDDIMVRGIFKPRRDCEDWIIPDRINFDESPFDDDNWIFQLNALRIIDPIIFHGIGCWEDLEYCCNHVINWIEYNDSTEDNGGFRWHDMATGLRAQKISYLLGILENEYPEKEELIEKFRISCSQHREKLMDPGFISPGNHGVFQIHGLMAVSIALNDGLSRDNYRYCSERISEMLASQFHEDGFHVENSPEYHFLMIRVFEQILGSEWYISGEIEVLWGQILEKACLLVWPDGNIIEVGDSNPAKVSIDYRNGFMKEYTMKIAQDKRFNGIELGLDYVFHHSKASGYTVIRSDFDLPNEESSMLFSLSSFNSRAHRQSDDLAFSLYEGGGVFVDCGKFAYGESEGRSLALSTRAHNCFQIDNIDYSRGGDDFYESAVSDITHFEWGTLIEKEKKWKELGVNQKRILGYSPGEFFCVIDMFSSEREREFKQWFHFHERFNNDFEVRGESLIAKDGDFKVSGWFNSSSEKPVELRRYRGEEDPLIGWRSAGYNQLIPINSISSRISGKSGFLCSFFVFDGKERKLKIEEIEDELSLIINGEDNSEEFVISSSF